MTRMPELTPPTTSTDRLEQALMPAALAAAFEKNALLDLDDPADDLFLQWEAAARTDADYCARRVVALDRQARQVETDAETILRQVAEWSEHELGPIMRRRAWYAARLEQFHRAELAKDPRHNKTVNLPCGVRLESQAGKITVEIDDEAKLLEWLEENEYPDAISYKDPTVAKRELTKLFGVKVPGPDEENAEAPAVDPNTGEAVPGVTFRRGERVFHARIPAPEPAPEPAPAHAETKGDDFGPSGRVNDEIRLVP